MATNILLVDDDAIQGSTRRAILERAGHSVSFVSDGHAALSFLEGQKSFATRLLITDHAMPRMTGPELVKAVRAAKYDFPVLVLSGFADAEEHYEGLNVAFRMKPFPPDQLIAFVNYLLHTSQLRSA